MTPDEAARLNLQYETYRRWYRDECLRLGVLPAPRKLKEPKDA